MYVVSLKHFTDYDPHMPHITLKLIYNDLGIPAMYKHLETIHCAVSQKVINFLHTILHVPIKRSTKYRH